MNPNKLQKNIVEELANQTDEIYKGLIPIFRVSLIITIITTAILSIETEVTQLSAIVDTELFSYILCTNWFITVSLGIFLFLRKQYLFRTEPSKLLRIYRTIEPVAMIFIIGNFIYSILMTGLVVMLAMKIRN